MAAQTSGEFTLKILGRTLEHLGVQMYKQRNLAIAELVANCWDAGAEHVDITLPPGAGYDPGTSEILIEDDGSGMSTSGVESDYLVVGRNRRTLTGVTSQPAKAAHGEASEGAAQPARRVMGRKGIGKLAGFGIAEEMEVSTRCQAWATSFVLDVQALKTAPGDVQDVKIPYTATPQGDEAHGTRVMLRRLKQLTPPDQATLIETLARRFSRTVRGSMVIRVNGETVEEPTFDVEFRDPPEADGWHEHTLSDGHRVKWWVAFSQKPLPSAELRGFSVYANNKTAQAPPFFFRVEGSMSAQHGTRYLTAAIEADFIDEGEGDDDDIISTDRQEIDWEHGSVAALYSWGQELTRRVVREWSERRGERAEAWVLQDEGMRVRLGRLGPLESRARSIIRSLGTAEEDHPRLLQLASALVAAFEYQHFHDFVEEIEQVAKADNPDALRYLLERLAEWKVLESRAILEIVRGRLQIADKFHDMIVNNAPETAPRVGEENLHDLIASYPWLLDPEWQVLAEERSISKQLWEWALADLNMTVAEARSRYDFIALEDVSKLLVIELKRPGHAVEQDELHRLLTYRQKLSAARERVEAVLVSGGHYNFDITQYSPSAQLHLLKWSDLHERISRYYGHWRDVLEGDVGSAGFANKREEVQRTREVVAYRDRDARRAGLGPQDAAFDGDKSPR